MISQYEVIAWCMEKFGERWNVIDNRNGTWACFWGGVNDPVIYDWYFLNEQDALLFTLKWA
jgi:hypothetical protein